MFAHICITHWARFDCNFACMNGIHAISPQKNDKNSTLCSRYSTHLNNWHIFFTNRLIDTTQLYARIAHSTPREQFLPINVNKQQFFGRFNLLNYHSHGGDTAVNSSSLLTRRWMKSDCSQNETALEKYAIWPKADCVCVSVCSHRANLRV